MVLFSNIKFPIDLELPDANVIYYPNFIDAQKTGFLFNEILNTTNWQQDSIRVYGKTYLQPRLTHLFATNNLPYSYANITMQPSPFTKAIYNLKQEIENTLKTEFTTCLANFYRDGNDSNGWHADNEKELGEKPIIASLSLGAERWFHLKHKNKKNLKQKILLTNGSLLVMKGNTQANWLHQIPKTKKEIGKRINLTFRIIK